VELEDMEVGMSDLGAHEVIVLATRSVISPGSELAYYRGHAQEGVLPRSERPGYPFHPGYAMAGTVLAAGPESGLSAGDAVLSHTPHQSVVRFDRREQVCLRLPDGLSVDVAPFARLAQVGAVSLQMSSARPGDTVAVLGLGPIGNLIAQLAAAASYVVVGVDPSPERRELGRRCGLDRVVSLEEADGELARLGGARLVLECSGRAAAVLLSTELCARHGEVMTVGVPWRPDPEVLASAVVARVFESYLALRSGWEWQVPLYGDGASRSVAGCTSWVFQRLLDASIRTAPLVGDTIAPEQVKSAYERLDTRPEVYATIIIDWER